MLVRPVVVEQREHLAGAIGDGAQHDVDADRRHAVHLDRQDARRQPLAHARQPRNQRPAARAVVEQQRGVLAAGPAIDRQEPAQARPDVGDAGVGKAQRARRTGRCAVAATHAQERVRPDLVAERDDGLGRAGIDAAGAAGLGVATVRAELLFVLHIARLLELAHHLRQPHGRLRLLQRIGARRQVAERLFGHSHQRLRGQVEHQVELLGARRRGAAKVDRTDRSTGLHARPVRLAAREIHLVRQVDRLLRTRPDAGVAAGAGLEIDRVDLLPLDLELAQIPLHGTRHPRPHRVATRRRQFRAARGRDEDGDRQAVGQLLGPRDRRLGRTDDQHFALRRVRDNRDRLRLRQHQPAPAAPRSSRSPPRLRPTIQPPRGYRRTSAPSTRPRLRPVP